MKTKQQMIDSLAARFNARLFGNYHDGWDFTHIMYDMDDNEDAHYAFLESCRNHLRSVTRVRDQNEPPRLPSELYEDAEKVCVYLTLERCLLAFEYAVDTVNENIMEPSWAVGKMIAKVFGGWPGWTSSPIQHAVQTLNGVDGLRTPLQLFIIQQAIDTLVLELGTHSATLLVVPAKHITIADVPQLVYRSLAGMARNNPRRPPTTTTCSSVFRRNSRIGSSAVP